MQALVTYIIVAGAAGYAAWLLMPHGLRRRLIAGLTRLAPSQRAALERLESAAECGGCSTCKGCEVGTQALMPGIPNPISRQDAKAPRTPGEPELYR